MTREPYQDGRQERETFSRRVARRETRKLRARRRRREGVWFGLGMFGLVGWSVAVPTLLGLALGLWIDATWPGRFSWTLMLLLAGVIIGCLNAWYWLDEESRAIEREERDNGYGDEAGE
jgi:ATP synthase protein I